MKNEALRARTENAGAELGGTTVRLMGGKGLYGSLNLGLPPLADACMDGRLDFRASQTKQRLHRMFRRRTAHGRTPSTTEAVG